MAQLLPLPLTVSCFSKIPIGFTFPVLAHPGSPGQRVVKRVRMRVLFAVGRRRFGAWPVSAARLTPVLLHPRSSSSGRGDVLVVRRGGCRTAISGLARGRRRHSLGRLHSRLGVGREPVVVVRPYRPQRCRRRCALATQQHLGCSCRTTRRILLLCIRASLGLAEWRRRWRLGRCVHQWTLNFTSLHPSTSPSSRHV